MDWEANLEKKDTVLVEWIDSSTENGWESAKHIAIDDGKFCLSVGYLLGVTEEFIVIAGDIDFHEKIYNRLIQIPRTSLKSVHKLSRGRSYGKISKKKS